MTPAGRSRQYVKKLCGLIGEEKIELGNACSSVALRKLEPSDTAAEVLIDAAEVVVGAGTGEGQEGEEADGKEDEENAGRWEVLDDRGNKRYFDEVSRRAYELRSLGGWVRCRACRRWRSLSSAGLVLSPLPVA